MHKPNQKKALTMAEAILTMVILGIIAAITIPQVMMNDPSKRGMTVLAQKMIGSLSQATTQMLVNNAGLDNLTILKNGDDRFNITDADVAPKMSKLFQKYLSNIGKAVDTTNEYFTQDIYDNKKVSTGIKVNSYSGFFSANDGVLLGFKFYGNCSTTETMAISPGYTTLLSVENICGSIYMDVNGYNNPNKLGVDQFIVPVGKRGITFEND